MKRVIEFNRGCRVFPFEISSRVFEKHRCRELGACAALGAEFFGLQPLKFFTFALESLP
jgi:hypothetical protein